MNLTGALAADHAHAQHLGRDGADAGEKSAEHSRASALWNSHLHASVHLPIAGVLKAEGDVFYSRVAWCYAVLIHARMRCDL